MASDDEKFKPEAQSRFDVTKAPIEEPEEGVFSAYANILNIDWTLYDLRIRFGELVQVPRTESSTWDDQRGVILERVMVTIPWHQAKILCSLLMGVIQNYEAINGELKQIKLPAPPHSEQKLL